MITIFYTGKPSIIVNNNIPVKEHYTRRKVLDLLLLNPLSVISESYQMEIQVYRSNIRVSMVIQIIDCI